MSLFFSTTDASIEPVLDGSRFLIAWKPVPAGRIFEKMSAAQNRIFSQGKSLFCSGNSLISLRAQRAFLENVGGLVVHSPVSSLIRDDALRHPPALLKARATGLGSLSGGPFFVAWEW